MKHILISATVMAVFIVHAPVLCLSGAYADGSGKGVHQHDTHSAPDNSIRISMTTRPEKLRAGEAATLQFSVRDGNGRPAKGVSISHDRILHVIIISEDLSVFAHVHPEDFGLVTSDMVRTAQFGVRYAFPRAGRYLVAADTSVRGAHISNHFMVDVSGEPEMQAQLRDLSREKKYGDYNVAFSHSPERIHAKKETLLRYEIKENGKPVTDLETYLAAPMHIAIVLADMSSFTHAHGTAAGDHVAHQPVGHIHGTSDNRLGPVIEAKVVFPEKGTYRIFSEVKHKGKVLLLDFMVEVE